MGKCEGKGNERDKDIVERAFDQSYEKAGGEVVLDLDRVNLVKAPVYWEVSDTDVNTKYKSMLPRFTRGEFNTHYFLVFYSVLLFLKRLFSC